MTKQGDMWQMWLRILRWGDYPELSRWTQCNNKSTYKRQIWREDETTEADAGVTCECVHAKAPQSCPTLCYSMDCSPPGSSVHRIPQARNNTGNNNTVKWSEKKKKTYWQEEAMPWGSSNEPRKVGSATSWKKQGSVFSPKASKITQTRGHYWELWLQEL